MNSAALFVEEALVIDGIREWLVLSVMPDCLTGTDDLFNPLLLGAMDDAEDLAASVM